MSTGRTPGTRRRQKEQSPPVLTGQGGGGPVGGGVRSWVEGVSGVDGEGDAWGVAEVVPEVASDDQGWCVVVVSACDVAVFGVRGFDG